MQISDGLVDKKKQENLIDPRQHPHSADFPNSSKNYHLSQDLFRYKNPHYNKLGIIGEESLPSMNTLYSPANFPIGY